MRWKRDRDFLYFSSRFYMTRKVPWIPFSSDSIDGSLDTLFPLSTVSYHIYQMYHIFDMCMQLFCSGKFSTFMKLTNSKSILRWLCFSKKLDVEKYVRNFRMEICSKSAFSAKRARFHKLPTFPQQGNSMPLFSNLSKPQIFWGQDFYN